MRFENLELRDLDIDDDGASYLVEDLTDEIVDATNKIRLRQGNTDLVRADMDNEVWYNCYLCFNTTKREITLEATANNSEKDDYETYSIELLPEEKEILIWQVVEALLKEV